MRPRDVLRATEEDLFRHRAAMKLSVIIPCYNAAKTIGVQLEALCRQTWNEPWEIVVSDNGSSDQTLAVVETFKNRIQNFHVVDSSDKPGSAHARNVGVSASSGELLAFCDADDEVGEGWIPAIGNALRNADFVASCFEIKKLSPSWCQFPHAQSKGLQRAAYPPLPSPCCRSRSGSQTQTP